MAVYPWPVRNILQCMPSLYMFQLRSLAFSFPYNKKTLIGLEHTYEKIPLLRICLSSMALHRKEKCQQIKKDTFIN
jgi:hypothetical protein